MEALTRAEGLVRATRAIADAGLRATYVRSILLELPIEELAAALDVICARAEQAEAAARETLVALVDALCDPACAEIVQLLREEAVGVPYLALERIVRPRLSTEPPRDVPDPEDEAVPDYGRGRPLTLGERKSLARRPTREMMDRLLGDPHPDVIRQLLGNPKITEDDVLRVAARRPSRPDILTEIARNTRWSHRPRVRVALVLNPDTPFELAAPILGLLMSHELKLVVTSPTVASPVRALCLEHLERRPPGDFAEESDGQGGVLQ